MIMHYHIVIITAKISKIKDRQGYLAASLALHPVCTVLALSSWVPTYK